MALNIVNGNLPNTKIFKDFISAKVPNESLAGPFPGSKEVILELSGQQLHVHFTSLPVRCVTQAPLPVCNRCLLRRYQGSDLALGVGHRVNKKDPDP